MRTPLLVLLLLATMAGSALAGPAWPDLTVALGGTGAVSGTPNSGGFSGSVAGMWPVEERFAFGISVFADDMGSELNELVEPGPPPVSFGTFPGAHRLLYGAGWRFDYEPDLKYRWRPFASATWDYVRIQDDTHGTVTNALSATRIGLGLGVHRNILKRSTVGVVVRFHRLSDDLVDQYASVTAEWGWRFGRTP
jgi:hypothetical protein